MKRTVLLYIVTIFVGIVGLVSAGTINFRGHSSFIHIFPGANFIVNQPISGVNGKIIKDSGSTLSGSTINFVDGLLQEKGNSLLLNAALSPAGVVTLSSNNYLKAARGTIFSSVQINGVGSRLEGSPVFTSPLLLQDINTTTTLALQSSVTQNIILNGGTVWLDDTLTFADNAILTGSGVVNVNGHRLVFGGKNFTLTSTLKCNSASDVSLNSEMDITGALIFSGVNTIQGNGNIINLLQGGSIIVDTNATLYMTDLVLKGIGGGSLIFSNTASHLVLSNVVIELGGNVTTSQGVITVSGPSTWGVKNFTWTFNNSASLIVDGVTLWKDKGSVPSFGTIVFSTGANYQLLNSGTICTIGCFDALQTSTGQLQSQLDSLSSNLRTSTGFLQSEIDLCCSLLRTSTGSLQSQLDVHAAMLTLLKTSTGLLQSEIDIFHSRVDGIEAQVDQIQRFTYQVELGNTTVLPPFASLDAGFVLHDSTTTATFDLIFPVAGQLNMNGGILYLNQDLMMHNNALLTGVGTILGNNHVVNCAQNMNTLLSSSSFVFHDTVVRLNADIEIQSTVICNGNCTIEGNGFTCDISNGQFLVGPASTVRLHHINIVGIMNSNLRCLDNAGVISLDTMMWRQSDDTAFALGALQFNNEVLMYGDALFVYESSQTSTITADATLQLEGNLTFSYDPVTGANNLLDFQDVTSVLQLNNAALHATKNGLQLTHGFVQIVKDSALSCDVPSQGISTKASIMIGDGTSANDCSIEIMPNVVLSLAQGAMTYNNQVTGIKMANNSAVLYVGSNAYFLLAHDLNIFAGILRFGDGATLIKNAGARIIGSVNVLGHLHYQYLATLS